MVCEYVFNYIFLDLFDDFKRNNFVLLLFTLIFEYDILITLLTRLHLYLEIALSRENDDSDNLLRFGQAQQQVAQDSEQQRPLHPLHQAPPLHSQQHPQCRCSQMSQGKCLQQIADIGSLPLSSTQMFKK